VGDAGKEQECGEEAGKPEMQGRRWDDDGEQVIQKQPSEAKYMQRIQRKEHQQKG